MKATRKLPPGYRPELLIDLTGSRLVLGLNAAGLGLLLVFGWLFLQAAAGLRPELEVASLWALVSELHVVELLLALAGVLILHEVVHGFFFWLYSRERPEFGFNLLYAYAAAPGWYFPRNQFVVIGLAPFVVLTAVGLILLAVLSYSWTPAIYVAITGNAAGAVGDFLVVYWLFQRPATAYIQDLGPKMIAYLDARPQWEAAWLALLVRFGVAAGPAGEAFVELEAQYSVGTRAYHNLDHVEQVLAQVDRLADEAKDADVVRLAAWFHDVIFDPMLPDSEARSAAYAAAVLHDLALPVAVVDEVERLIRLTGDYTLPTWEQATAGDRNAHVLLDADLASLAVPWPEFTDIATRVGEEYSVFPAEEFRAGRIKFLGRLLEREQIYYTAPMVACCEALARENIRREIARLERTGGMALEEA